MLNILGLSNAFLFRSAKKDCSLMKPLFSSNAVTFKCLSFLLCKEICSLIKPLFQQQTDAYVTLLTLQFLRYVTYVILRMFCLFSRQKWMHCHRIGLVLEHDV